MPGKFAISRDPNEILITEIKDPGQVAFCLTLVDQSSKGFSNSLKNLSSKTVPTDNYLRCIAVLECNTELLSEKILDGPVNDKAVLNYMHAFYTQVDNVIRQFCNLSYRDKRVGRKTAVGVFGGKCAFASSIIEDLVGKEVDLNALGIDTKASTSKVENWGTMPLCFNFMGKHDEIVGEGGSYFVISQHGRPFYNSKTLTDEVREILKLEKSDNSPKSICFTLEQMSLQKASTRSRN